MWRRLIKWTNNTCIQTSIFSVVLTFIKFSVEYYIPCPNKEFTKTSNLICSCYFMYTLYSVLYICYQLLNEKCLQNAIVQQTYVQLQLAFQLQVALLYGGSFYCAGSIISPTCVVTAASCVFGYVCTEHSFCHQTLHLQHMSRAVLMWSSLRFTNNCAILLHRSGL